MCRRNSVYGMIGPEGSTNRCCVREVSRYNYLFSIIFLGEVYVYVVVPSISPIEFDTKEVGDLDHEVYISK